MYMFMYMMYVYFNTGFYIVKDLTSNTQDIYKWALQFLKLRILSQI